MNRQELLSMAVLDTVQQDIQKLSYEEAIELSAKNKQRSPYETLLLREFIQYTVHTVQTCAVHDAKKAKEGLHFLISAYEKFITAIAYSILTQSSFRDEYADLKQMMYEVFINLVYKYDANVASFSYYIKQMFPLYARECVKKYNASYVPISEYIDIYAPSTYNTFDLCTAMVMQERYVNFILHQAAKDSRTETIKTVCIEHFLENKKLSYIAKTLGITYTAVYQVAAKIKFELCDMFNNDPYCSYHIDPNTFTIVEKAGV